MWGLIAWRFVRIAVSFNSREASWVWDLRFRVYASWAWIVEGSNAEDGRHRDTGNAAGNHVVLQYEYEWARVA